MDEIDRRTLDAWTVEPLSEGFEDRVMRTWEARWSASRPRRRGPAIGLALACASAAALAVWLVVPKSPSGGAMALGEYGIATPEPGTILRTEVRDGTLVIAQTEGRADYEIETGKVVWVETPAGTVTVRGTSFRVEVEPVQSVDKRLWGISGAVLAGTVAVYVAVSEGAVDVRNEHGEMALRAGEATVATDATAPASASNTAPSRSTDGAVAMAKPSKRRTLDPSERATMLKRIDDALAARAVATKAIRPSESPSEPEPESEPEEMAKLRWPALDEDYIREVIGDDLIPVAKECYDDALGQNPSLNGRLVMQFTIVGDEEVGGIVESASLGEETDLDDPSLRECVIESLMHVAFAPPEGGGRVEVTYPMVFEPANGDGEAE